MSYFFIGTISLTLGELRITGGGFMSCSFHDGKVNDDEPIMEWIFKTIKGRHRGQAGKTLATIISGQERSPENY
jgi:hypothetical protein